MTDLREDLDNAIDNLSADTTGTGVQRPDEALPPPEETEVHAEEEQAEETTAAAPDAEAGAAEEDGDSEAGESGETTTEAESGEGGAPPKQNLSAPVDWSPKARENWSKLPTDVQEQILDREKHIAKTLEGSSDARKVADEIARLGHAYAPVMAAEGVSDPLQAVQGLFNTAAKLRNGTQQQKAEQLAAMIDHYGVDIVALDTVLAGRATPAQPGLDPQIDQLLNERMAPVNDLLSRLNEQQQTAAQQEQSRVAAEIAAFQGEFKDDLRMEMADLIDLGAMHGRKVSLQQAYDAAVAANPEISAILAQRKAAEQLTGRQESLADKRAAASSIAPRGGQPTAPGDLSLREQLEASWQDS